jgi:hypothetical protein
MERDIFYIQAYATDKHYGRALNKHIELLPDDCWIVVTDGDTCFLSPDYGQIIAQAVQDHPEASLMTCRTNRAYGQGYNPDPDMIEHYRRSVLLSKSPKRYTPVYSVMPGFFWLFPKSTWLKKPFDDHTLIWNFDSFDTRWCRGMGGKKYLIEHLYVFHYYRLHDKEKKIDHLK